MSAIELTDKTIHDLQQAAAARAVEPEVLAEQAIRAFLRAAV